MKKTSFCSLALLFTYAANSQLHISGSYSITAKCKDGIIMVADSRGSLYYPNDEDNIIAYFDTVQKVFPIRNFAFSVTGPLAINGTFLSSYLKEFEKLSFQEDWSSGDILNEFHKFYTKYYPDLKSEFHSINLTCAKFVGDTAEISFMKYGKIYEQLESISTDELSEFQNYSVEHIKSLTCNEVYALITKSIDIYVEKYKKWKKIGGPYMAIKISKEGVSWFTKPPVRGNWSTIRELQKDFLQGKCDFQFADQQVKEDYQKWLVDQFNK